MFRQTQRKARHEKDKSAHEDISHPTAALLLSPLALGSSTCLVVADTNGFGHGNLSWIFADQIHLARVKSSPDTINDLKKYLMCVTDSWPTVAKMTSCIPEADDITGPWRMVAYLKDFGEQGYFLNFPSKFISTDGKTL